MSAQEFREDVQRALKRAVADDVDADDLETILDEMQSRVDAIRTLEGSA